MNRKIWIYWHQGFDKCPWIVTQCVNRWIVMHPDWEIILLSEISVNDYIHGLPIPTAIQQKMKIAHISDLIRTQLLIKYGGVWVDPTTYPLMPLDNWLPDCMSAGLFFFRNPGRDRVIANWFIAAEQKNPILEKLFNELCYYWSKNSFRNLGKQKQTKLEVMLNRIINRNEKLPYLWFSFIMRKIVRITPYMVYHYMFRKVVYGNSEFKKQFESIPYMSADAPHYAKRIGLLSTADDKFINILKNKNTPLFKLDWKLLQGKNLVENSVLSMILISD